MTEIVIMIQLGVSIIIGIYFFSQLKTKRITKVSFDGESKAQMERLRKLRGIRLNIPLSEKTRPQCFEEIIGQKEGIMALSAALCGENPQHVLIYGPPGIGKTCAARLVLDKAKMGELSPFMRDAKFIEIDAACLRYDERNIADPLIGSVHDPIYQGAGAYGIAGVPQPKEGAVTRAHGGILFLDEIGELHPYHINKLLKVLEDRRVCFDSAYYSKENKNIPQYIHDIFSKGMPADFRLVGATTKSPREIPSAIRSRCMEIYFRQLYPDEVIIIAKNAAVRAGCRISPQAAELIGEYAANGRDAVNIVSMSAGVAREKHSEEIKLEHVLWIIETGKYTKRPVLRLGRSGAGCVNGLAVYGSSIGTIIEVETVAVKSAAGSLTITGLVDEEEMGFESRKFRRKSSAKSSVENVLTALQKNFGINPSEYYIHINMPGSAPIDGPSAGMAIAVSVFSAVTGRSVMRGVAMTGEISINGCIRAVGGVKAKVSAARRAGASLVLIPKENMEDIKGTEGVRVIGVRHISEVIKTVFAKPRSRTDEVLSAQGSYTTRTSEKSAASQDTRE